MSARVVNKLAPVGLRALTVDELQKMSQPFNLTTHQITKYDGKIPTEVIIEVKTTVEQIRLIQQLEEEDKQTIYKLIDKILTNNNKNISSVKFFSFFSKYTRLSDVFFKTNIVI